MVGLHRSLFCDGALSKGAGVVSASGLANLVSEDCSVTVVDGSGSARAAFLSFSVALLLWAGFLFGFGFGFELFCLFRSFV